MPGTTKRTVNSITIFYLVLCFLPASAGSADSNPSAEDVNRLSDTVKFTVDAFMQQSFEPRMEFEYYGEFPTEADKNKLYQLAKKAGEKLGKIKKEQKELKRKIENYQGSDWDKRYGLTGLWRKLSVDLYQSTLSKCQIDFYLALAAEQPQKNKISQAVLAQIESLNKIHNTAHSDFLKAKTLALLGRTNLAFKLSAKKEFALLSARSDLEHSTALRIAIERIKLFGESEPGQLTKLAETIAKSKCKDELELLLSLAFLQRRLNRTEEFKRTVNLFPRTEEFLGRLFLSQLSASQLTEQKLQQTDIFEAELAAQAIWKSNTKEHKTLLGHLAGAEKFQTPLILYVTASGFAETSPDKAVELLIKASNSQRLQKNSRLDIEPVKIAAQAAQLAYNLFVEDANKCPLVIEAFENYQQIAAAKIDQALEYLYSIVLNGCGRSAESEKLLEKIAARPEGIWRSRAKLDLIIRRMEQAGKENKEQQNKLFEELRDFILNCRRQDKNSNSLHREAITVYCQSLLETGDETSAQKVLTILDNTEAAGGIQLDLFKSKALQQLGQMEMSVHHMVLAIILDSGSPAEEVTELVGEVVDKIEQVESQADNFNKMINDCKKLAKFSYISLNDRQSALLFAEISILAAEKDKGQLSEAERLLRITVEDGTGDIDSVRCRARLLREQGKFEQAAKLWTKICQKRRAETRSATQRNWKWWRAKYYELDCWAKCPQTKKQDVLHTIEVLENSFTEIPLLWAKKLMMLRQYCRRQPNDAGK